MKESMTIEDRINLSLYRREVALERLRAAEVLFKEGFYNDAITRAYYAIHSISRALLILYDIRATTHEGVKTMLSKQLVREAKVLSSDFAKKFSILKALREDADYEDFIRFSSTDAEEALKIARDFLEKTSDVIDQVIKDIRKS